MYCIRCVEEAKRLYPGRVSVDVIFGRPGQTVEAWVQELRKVRKMSVFVFFSLPELKAPGELIV